MHADLYDMHLIAVMLGVIVVGPIIMWALVQIANKRWKSKGTLIQRSAWLFAARIRAIFRRGCKGQSDLLIARKNPRINRVRYWRPLSGFLFLRRVSPDREGGIIAALPSMAGSLI